MKRISTLRLMLSIALLVLTFSCYAQKRKFFNHRQRNVISPAAGSALLNNDLDNPNYETFGQLGYKRFLTRHWNVNMDLTKFNLQTEDFLDKGFLSLNFNLEYYILPDNAITPYFFVGGGMLTSNEIRETINKFQLGLGVEYLITGGFGLTLSTNGSYLVRDQIDQEVYADVDGILYGAAMGLNFYFGRRASNKRSRPKSPVTIPTVIETYPILSNK